MSKEETRQALLLIGFTNDEINRMAVRFKKLLNLTPNTIELKFNELLAQGLNTELAHNFLVYTPSIFGMGIDNIRQKFNILRDIFQERCTEVIGVNPMRLVQGPGTTAARYEYFINQNLTIDEIERNLFITRPQFKKRYKIDL
ncbi:hypothetical protein JCM14036_03210 [Desulfotomaculum defluvii]